MGLSIMILISMVSTWLPNASSKETEPLVNVLYKTAIGAFGTGHLSCCLNAFSLLWKPLILKVLNWNWITIWFTDIDDHFKVTQLLIVIFTDWLKSWTVKLKQKDYISPVKNTAERLQSDTPVLLKTLVEKLEEINQALKDDESKVQGSFRFWLSLHHFVANKYWRSVAWKINFATFCIMMIIEIGVIGFFLQEIKKSKALDWQFTIIE